jgi:hypothetical protein
VWGKLTRCGILVSTYPLHTSHIFQVFHILLFGILEKLRTINARMTPGGEKWITFFGYSVLMSSQRPPR